MKHLVLVDGYGFVFRAFHSMPPLTRKDGKEVGALLGFTNMMIKLFSEIDASHIGVAFDSGGKNFRHELYPEYKAHRPPAPQELIEQFPLVRQAVQALNVTILEKMGVEADDIIATLATYAAQQDFKVTIVSSDKDLMQLINDHIVMYDPLKNKLITDQQVVEKFGVNPNQVQDILALIGDSSDNIPGVKGIGPKGAAELINQFGDIENLYQNIQQLKPSKKKEALIACEAEARLSYRLVALDKIVELTKNLDDLVVKKPIRDDLQSFIERNQFRSMQSKIAKLFNDNSNNFVISMEHFNRPQKNKITDIDQLITNYEAQKYLYLLPLNENIIVGYDQENYLLLAPDELWKINTLLDNSALIKISFNFKKLLKISSCKITSIIDIQLLAYSIDSTKTQNNLQDFYHNFCDIDDLVSDPQQMIELIITALPQLLLKLQSFGLNDLFYNLEQPLIEIFNDIENNGIKIDIDYLRNLTQDFAEHLAIIEQDIFRLSGVSFNIASPKQLGEILFVKLNLPAPKKNKTGWSTDSEVLEQLSLQGHVIADKTLEWRGLNKLLSTYTDSLINQADAHGRIHTTFSLAATITGRLSSSQPNLQNIPIRSEEGKKIRKAFIAANGCKLISADYSQIELRILAHLANIDSLRNAFINNQDIHALTASEVFNIPLNEIGANERRKAKAINFGIIYGISSFGLAKQLMIGRNDAKKIIDRYFETYPGIKQYMDNIQQLAREQGYVSTILGRRCYIKDINSSNHIARNFSERLAINAPIQGSAADIIKLATIKIAELLKNYNAKILLQVHDELIIEAANEIAEQLSDSIRKNMDNIIKLNVPLITDVSIGNNWGEL